MIPGSSKRRIHVTADAMERVAFTTGRPIEFTADSAVLVLPTCELRCALAAVEAGRAAASEGGES